MPQKITITINDNKYSAQTGETILDICLRNDIFIPTLCKHPDLPIQGKCRVCLVEVAGQGLVTSCSTPVAKNMKIITNSDNVKRARKTNLEMIYAAHIEKCSDCIEEENCPLKKYAHDYDAKITRYKDRKGNNPQWNFGAWSDKKLKARLNKIEYSCFAKKEIDFRTAQAKLFAQGFIEFDSSKCIDCGICPEICNNKQTVNFYETKNKGHLTQTKPTNDRTKDCTYCGQCIVHCPVGAIQGVPHWPIVEELIKNKKKHGKLIVAQIAPSVRVSIGEEFGLDYGEVVTDKLVGSAKNLGFDEIFDVTAGADFTTYEEARELIHWLERKKDTPMITSCCPGWVKFVEFYYPDFVPHLTSARSPQIMSGALIKSYWAEATKRKPENIIVVSIMPCTAKKQEISLERHILEFVRGNDKFKLPAVDYVLTTREYAYLLKRHQIDLKNVKPVKMNNFLGKSSGAGVIYGASGGVMESALRTADAFMQVKQKLGSLKSVLLGKDYYDNKKKLSKISNQRIEFKEARGMKGLKEAAVEIGGTKLKIAIVNELSNARQLLDNLKAKKCRYDYIEVMACPGGCIGGGGQPVPVTAEIRTKRADSLYLIDKKLSLRTAHSNKALLEIYRDYFRGDESKIEEILHCHYNDLSRGGYQEIIIKQ